ncbi:MAG: hypothetical protein MK100_05785 [Phycisphaerales bacterium]|nr:hypothetical protein [Phycisphaerales bacterium]
MQLNQGLLSEETSIARPERDRLLLLGRRTAGKTVFLARLYEQAWKGAGGLRMRAREGAMHQRCMEVVEQLQQGKWPDATAGSMTSEVEVVWDGRAITMVMLDYPGEVFRQAFVEGGHSDQVASLIEHVDAAAAILLLIDPGNVRQGEIEARIDDDYGMVAAVDYIRKSSGGTDVPIAVALTKCDEHVGLVRSEGGARGFVERHMPNLIHYGNRMRIFATAAVRTRRDALGRPVPSTQHPPDGLVDVVKYCMKHVGRALDEASRENEKAARRHAMERAVVQDQALSKRHHQKWGVFWTIVAIVSLIVVAGAFMVAFGS